MATLEAQELIERFLAAYNAIDRELRHRLHLAEYIGFGRAVDLYAQQQPYWSAAPSLRAIAELRNFLVHEPDEPFERLAIPTPRVVAEIEAIRERFDERVLPRFQGDVVRLESIQTLADVFAMINATGHSQYPVYRADGAFAGLLTENGITRWLAHHVTSELTLVEFTEIAVQELLTAEEKRPNYTFVERQAKLIEVEGLFRGNPVLEAVMITQHGKQNEKAMGIVTRWDVLNGGGE